tara:strand:- start:553 stop:1704 length:1152 start_codon:yes stop_codon:yes gene_type:complete
MEEENKEVVEETTQEITTQVDESKFESAGDDSVVKVDLSAPPPLDQEVETEVVADKQELEEVVAEVANETETQEELVLEEVAEGETVEVEEQVQEVIAEAQATGKPLPENIQKLVDFMEETGGDLNDYVKLNQDYSKLDESNLLYEFYKQTKPHLNQEEINFLMDDQFAFDEDTDEDIDIRRKKLALKEQVANAKSHLDGQKSKYYEEIKLGSKLPDEAKKAMDFFNRYNKESEETLKSNEKSRNSFTLKTNNVFNNEFKGFEYNVGDKNYRFNVKDADRVKSEQSDINKFMTKFVNEDSTLKDANGYHKALFTASNPDAVAKHFYEQGKADAMKASVEKGKNINMDPRQTHGKVQASGTKFKVLGGDSTDYAFKIKNNKFKN